MKRKTGILIFCQAVFTILQVYFISKISWIGKIGIRFAYKEYSFLRSPLKTYMLLFGVQLIVIALLIYAYNKLDRKKYLLTIAGVVVVTVIGLLFTYNDFSNTYTHRLLKERFHLGFYLFWLGIIASCVFFAVLPRPIKKGPDSAEPLEVS